MKYKGDIEGFPEEVVNWMLDQQEKQGNKMDVTVFELDKWSDKSEGGFDWGGSDEDHDFCSQIITRRAFDVFFKRYPSGYILVTEADALKILAEHFKTDKIKII